MNKDGGGILSIDILRRFKPLNDVIRKAALYYPYAVNDGERPDVVAHKIYGNADYHWILMMFNEMDDPYFSWYMSYQDFVDFINKKYGDIQRANEQIHHYEWIVQQRTDMGLGVILPEKTLVVDYDTYYGLIDEERRVVTAYDYEVNLNKSHQIINIIDKQYLPQILAEKSRLLQQ